MVAITNPRSNTFNNITKSDRREALERVSTDLREIDGQLDAFGKDEQLDAIDDVEDVGRALSDAADHFVQATGHAAGGLFNVGASGFFGAKGTAHVVTGAGLAGASAAADGAELGANAGGRFTQWLGKLFIEAGNEARETADLGGQQLDTFDVAGDAFAPRWGAGLRELSAEQLELAGKSYLASLAHVAGAVANGVMGTVELGRAAKSTYDAAVSTLAAAKDLADAAVIEVAERAVELAGVAVKVVDKAVEYGELGVDTAGEALQAAGRGLVAAGNAVNSARGTDTAVRPE